MNFDYIIVGAGAAGCVLAERLTANGRNRVLVLEAGGTDRRFYIQMPLGYGKTFYDPKVNWGYWAEADAGLAGQRDYWPRGKVLGGSSSINAMVYVRGDASDFEDWKAAGNVGWGWEDVLPAFKELEDYESGADVYRGAGGPLYVSANLNDHHWLCGPFEKAAQEAGLAFNPDFNGATQEGVGNYQLTVKNGRRNSAARAFLRPAMKRRNLQVIIHAQATRVVMAGGKAIGVEYQRHGQTHIAHAACEVILCGGAVNSPQLLQLSGIGPGSHLQSLGIPVLAANENVGRNLQDHLGINYTYRMTVPTMNSELRPWWGKLRVGLHYLLLRRGPLSISINQGGGFFRTNPSRTRANMQLYFQAFSTLVPKEGERPLLSPDPFYGASIGLSNCRPTSRGEIMITGNDPLAKPRIVANAFSTDHDVQEMLEAVKFIRKIAAQPAFAQYVAEELRPGPAVNSDEDIIADFRKRSGTVYHPSCTCRMGTDAKSGVVDAQLRLHGVQNLRVVDASSFPSIISGNLNAPTMMLAWKAAKMILAS
ncbi:MAG: GMC family oxidoreductase N-terminal domain-containing protein [Alphaproteobacteria bacterium]|nr:GMC family oxidoreductase N-terminal domain-containing protein [Alphaproteobacteria bacterium]